jgi:hypothetical protein
MERSAGLAVEFFWMCGKKSLTTEAAFSGNRLFITRHADILHRAAENGQGIIY